MAIEEAELILGLLFEAGPSGIRKQQEALDLFYADDPAVYDPARDMTEALAGLRDKIDVALRRHKLAISEWRKDAEAWVKENRQSSNGDDDGGSEVC